MSDLFRKPLNTQCFLKAGIMGFAGSGKTYTATKLAIGLVHLMRDHKMPRGDLPAMFIDTETGSDWVKPEFDAANVEMLSAKTRAFTDLLEAVNQTQANGSILIIDSITHFWRELCDTYKTKMRRSRLEFQDWAVLKGQWAMFTDLFVNSQAHIIMCGRAGFEYDHIEDEGGKKQLQKVGVKMKAETETGYEPSILILMEREHNVRDNSVSRMAYILKDRSTRLDGKAIPNPTFADFKPHIDFLNLGGSQIGVDTERTSEALFTPDGKPFWKYREEQKEIVLDKIKSLFIQHGMDGTGKDEKFRRVETLKECFGTTSWREVELSKLEEMTAGFRALHIKLNGVDPFSEDIPGAEQAEPTQAAA